MQSFRQWFDSTMGELRQGGLGPGDAQQKPLRIVMGNTSCDMDSAVGALVLAYYYSKKYDQRWVPVINCERKNFAVNLEIVHHLRDCEIDPEQLYFYNEFRAQYPDPEQVAEMALIDHNKLDPSQEDLASKVTRVIDHHVDSGAYDAQLLDKQVRKIGSACTIVAKMLRDEAGLFQDDIQRQPESQSKNLVYLVAAAVVLDSHYFDEELKGKWTDEDTEAHEWLMLHADVNEAYWNALQKSKYNVQACHAMGLNGIFIRDYKVYDLNAGRMGVSVAYSSVEGMLDHFQPQNFAEACRLFKVDQRLGLFVIMATMELEDDSYSKQILIFEGHENPSGCSLRDKAEALHAHIEAADSLQLRDKKQLDHETLGGHGKAVYYTIGNLKVSRKFYEAIVKSDQSWQD